MKEITHPQYPKSASRREALQASTDCPALGTIRTKKEAFLHESIEGEKDD